MTELIITEKPQASKKIAEALADGKPLKKLVGKVPYYLVTHGDQDIVVGCAVGHLFSLEEKEKSGWTYPVFEVDWQQSSEIRKNAKFTEAYVKVLKKLAKDAKEFTVATDYDIEGEVIGHNVVKYICKKKDANRMKFSTLTKNDLIEAYEKKSKTLNWGQANAGETRHILDWLYGINSSRALTASIKSAGLFQIMSTGRVQGPALKIIVDREKEIKAFVPVPYWQLSLNGHIEKYDLEAWHHTDKFWNKEEADAIYNKIKGEKEATISKVEAKSFQQKPPVPFDLTSLQIEVYRAVRIQPKATLSIAQELYSAGYISYPRTSSQQLPKEIGYTKILKGLAKQENYAELTKVLLAKTKLEPNNGKKTDPAHPAIYPTGTEPKKLKEDEQKVYDVIARRFMATFGDPAMRETQTITIDVKEEPFKTKGTHTKEPGWHIYYEPYLDMEEATLPPLKEKSKVDLKKIDQHAKETQPPKHYTQASIIKELEKRNLGTKATRSSIVDTLYTRGYIDGRQIIPTDLGIKTIETLEKHVPKIVDEELTRHFELEMEEIRENKKGEKEVIEEAKKLLVKIFKQFKDQEKEIGEELGGATKEHRRKTSTVGKCQECKDGTLVTKRGRFGLFIACDKYPDCKVTIGLPSNALSKVTEEVCEVCNYPKLQVIKKGKRPQVLCLNNNCDSKKVDLTEEEKKKLEATTCPRCEQGKLALRNSIYGQFYACDRYPKCRYSPKAEKDPVKEMEAKEKKDE